MKEQMNLEAKHRAELKAKESSSSFFCCYRSEVEQHDPAKYRIDFDNRVRFEMTKRLT